MSFHKRRISNKQTLHLFNDGGVSKVIEWYTGKFDSLILENGLSNDINNILKDSDWSMFCQTKAREEIINRIHKELGLIEPKK